MCPQDCVCLGSLFRNEASCSTTEMISDEPGRLEKLCMLSSCSITEEESVKKGRGAPFGSLAGRACLAGGWRPRSSGSPAPGSVPPAISGAGCAPPRLGAENRNQPATIPAAPTNCLGTPESLKHTKHIYTVSCMRWKILRE